MGQYEKHIHYLLKSIALKKQMIEDGRIKDREQVVVDLMNLGELYLQLEQGEMGIKYIKDARNYIVSYPNYIAHNYKDMADAYLILGKLPEARIYYDSLTAMLTPANKSALHRYNRIASDLAFAEYHLTNKNADSAYLYMKRAGQLAQKWPEQYLKIQMDYMLGKVHLSRNESKKALVFLQAAEKASRNLDPLFYVSVLQLLAQAYGGSGQYRQAYQTYDKYAPLRDSLYVQASKKSSADAEALYQNKDKERQIELKNIQLSDAKKERIWFITGLLLLGTSVALLAFIYINKKRNAELLNTKNRELARLIGELEEANSTKAKLFSIISHDLRSPISQVYQFLKLQQLNPHLLSEVQRAELSERIQTATGSLLETMEDLLLWSKTQMNQFRADIQPVRLTAIADQCLKLLQLNIEARNLHIENLVADNTMVHADPYYLQAIIRNLLQNAIKASDEHASIRLVYSENEDSSFLSIENTGDVFSQQEYLNILAQTGSGLSGLGLKLADELSVKTGLKIRFENPSQNRTRALIIFEEMQ
jgi:signal transduction histidine kinase